jgi:site-specific recombinase XerC
LVKRFALWLVDEGELDSDPLLGVKQPKLDRKVVDALTDDELKRPTALPPICGGVKRPTLPQR